VTVLRRPFIRPALRSESPGRSVRRPITRKESENPSAKLIEGWEIGRPPHDNQQVYRSGEEIPVEAKGLPDKPLYPVTHYGASDPLGHRDSQARKAEVGGLYDQKEDVVGKSNPALLEPFKVTLTPDTVPLGEGLFFHQCLSGRFHPYVYDRANRDRPSRLGSMSCDDPPGMPCHAQLPLSREGPV
jgi:hypothetical protein